MLLYITVHVIWTILIHDIILRELVSAINPDSKFGPKGLLYLFKEGQWDLFTLYDQSLKLQMHPFFLKFVKHPSQITYFRYLWCVRVN